MIIDYVMDNIQIRYLPSLICVLFFIISKVGFTFMKEDLIRNKKDEEVSPNEQDVNGGNGNDLDKRLI